MLASDGKVIISTELDNSNIEKDAKELNRSLKSQAMKLAHEYKKQGMDMSAAMKKAYAEIGAAGKKSTAQVSASVGKISGSLGGLSNVVGKLGVAIAAAFSVRTIVNFSKACLDLGSDLQEVQNVVDVTFTTLNEQVNEFAKNAAQTAGLSETMAKRYAGTFGAMAKSFKFTEAEAYEMSTSLTQLAGDVASFYNLSQDAAYTKLKSVFSGETETLKDLGVVMTQSALDAFALQKGLKKTTSQMTEQEKVALRYQFVMEQLSGASGDFVRTSDSWANQTRLLNLQWEQLMATLGQGFINVLTPVVQWLNTIISKLQEAANAFTAFTTELFGNAGGSTGAVIEGASDSLGSAADNAGELEENAKKAKRALAGFDEINRLQTAESDSTSDTVIRDLGTAGTGSTAPDMSQLVEDSSELEGTWTNIAKSCKDFWYEVVGKIPVKNLENFKTSVLNLQSGWDNLMSTIGGEGFSLSDLIADAVGVSLLVNAGGNKMMGGLLDMIAESRKYFSGLGSDGSREFLDESWLNALFTDADVWDSLGETIAGWGMAISSFVPEDGFGFGGFTKEEWENLFLPITEEYTNLYRGLSGDAAEALAEYTKVYQKLKTKANKMSWSDAVITESDVDEVKDLTEDLYNTIVRNNKEARESAEASIADLLEQGLIDEESAKKAILDLENTYSAQEQLLSENKTRINGILEEAKNNNRALTAEEQAEILSLLEESNDKTVAVISQGASDSTEIYRMLEENRGKMSKQMLSQAIQYANDEYDAKVKAANDTYTASIENADKLYYELGVIDAAEYERIKKEAEEKKKVQIEEATEAKEALIKEAQAAAGGVADAVDPETGEILSNWEVLWNSMFNKVKSAWENIKQTCKDFINQIIDFLNIPNKNANAWFDKFGGTSFFGLEIPSFSFPEIPHLASGAVIPPNREFMAVLGDQRHGTNIEAPLSTIQEAVAQVMADYEAANLAGHEATVGILQQILSAVLGIEVGDTTIGQAANRYNQKMAVIKGGL